MSRVPTPMTAPVATSASPLGQLLGLFLMIILMGTALDSRGQDDDSAGDDFVIIVHVANPTTNLEQSRVSKIFLKKIKSWEHGGRIIAFDLEDDSGVRSAFTQTIHGKSTTAIDSYWQRMIFSGRDVPPDKVKSEKEMIAKVAANKRAIGYVSAQADLPESLKVLEVTTK